MRRRVPRRVIQPGRTVRVLGVVDLAGEAGEGGGLLVVLEVAKEEAGGKDDVVIDIEHDIRGGFAEGDVAFAGEGVGVDAKPADDAFTIKGGEAVEDGGGVIELLIDDEDFGG